MRDMAKGFFITVEGIDGSGKSTQVRSLAGRLVAAGYPVRVTREPGGTPMAEDIRQLLLQPRPEPVEPWTEVLLYAAARAQHVAGLIRPALVQGQVVVCDRFVDSSVAYQGYGRGLDAQRIRDLNRIATGGLEPDLTLVLDIDPAVGMARLCNRKKGPGGLDRLEQEQADFHRLVRHGYREMAETEGKRMVIISAEQPPERVADLVWDVVRERLAR